MMLPPSAFSLVLLPVFSATCKTAGKLEMKCIPKSLQVTSDQWQQSIYFLERVAAVGAFDLAKGIWQDRNTVL